jgi:hypothetical protein
MPVTVSNTNTNININSAGQQTAQGFALLAPGSTIGPVQSTEVSTSSASNQVQAVVWDVIPQMTIDLQNAIIDFINTDKDGNFIPNQNNQPRSKTITFEFQGSPSNVYKFGELGTVNIVLGYPSLIISSQQVQTQSFQIPTSVFTTLANALNTP